MGHPIKIIDLVIYRLKLPKDIDKLSGAHFEEAKLPMFGGCEGCQESLGGYNAYPSVSGYLRCKSCIGEDGYSTVESANEALFPKFRVLTDFEDVYRDPTDILEIEARGAEFYLKWDQDVLNVYENGKVIGTIPIKPRYQ